MDVAAGQLDIQNGAGNAVILLDDGDRNLYFFDKGGEYISWDGTDLRITSGTDPNNSYGFNYNLLNDHNFFSQVWQKTLGGTLPFIFQPDKDNNNPDQFAICKFKQNSLKATQSAHNVYDISLDIEEVW